MSEDNMNESNNPNVGNDISSKREKVATACLPLYDKWLQCIEEKGYNNCILPHRKRYYRCVDLELYAADDSAFRRIYKTLYMGGSEEWYDEEQKTLGVTREDYKKSKREETTG